MKIALKCEDNISENIIEMISIDFQKTLLKISVVKENFRK
jgi:hypothetical protein